MVREGERERGGKGECSRMLTKQWLVLLYSALLTILHAILTVRPVRRICKCGVCLSPMS